MLKHLMCGSIAALTLSAGALAKDAAPGPVAAPAELGQLDYFVGTWICSGKTEANPAGAEHATTATVRATRAVGGRWIHISYDENKTAANPMPYHAGVYIGYDAGRKQFVESCVDAMGGYCTQSSSGWSGDVMVFEGTANGMGEASGARDTFTRKAPNEISHQAEMQGADKKWVKTDEEHCHRGK